jgi:hypothetical protein
MNIETIFSAIAGVVDQARPDTAPDQDSDFTGFVWPNQTNAGPTEQNPA